MDKTLLSKVIQRKRKALTTFTLEQTATAGVFGGFIGLILGGFYDDSLNGLVWNIANVFLYAIIGIVIGYYTSKKEDLRVELMLLESLAKSSRASN